MYEFNPLINEASENEGKDLPRTWQVLDANERIIGTITLNDKDTDIFCQANPQLTLRW